jgi:glycosyltransferase involved in cell wall biosynthesis
MPLVSVFTPSYNKGHYATEAIACILAQDFTDFEFWILENSTDGETRETIAPLLGDPRIVYEEIEFGPGEREACYPTARLLNRYYAKAAGKYIVYLSDDDLLDPRTLRLCVEFLEADTSRKVCYFGLRHASLRASGFMPTGGIPALHPMGAGTDLPVVDSRIDGGQIAHRTDCLEVLEQPWFPEQSEPGIACHADGLFMQKLAREFTFHPLNETLVTHRRTPLSTWDKGECLRNY